MRFSKLTFSAAVCALSVAALACSAGQGDSNSGGGGSGTNAQGTGTSTGTSQGGAGSTTNASTTATGFATVGSTTDAGVGGGSCAATSVQTQEVPLDMVIVLDESGSMSGMKWDTVTAALKSFIQDPTNDGIGVGIVFFPNFNADDCNFTDYENLNVDIGELPGNAPALVASINSQFPQGGTPTYGALKGALYKATGWQDANPTHKVIVVFASDGDPTSCSITDIPTIAALASSAHNYNGVQTFVIAMAGATVANLDQIAAAGGTNQAYDVTGSVQQFSQKMQEIRSTALSCEFIIPPPPMGQTLDPHLVNVVYTPGGTGNAQSIPKADNLADCGAGPGWYYDNDMNPTKIELCPGSCNTVQNDSQAKVDVAFGCSTIPN